MSSLGLWLGVLLGLSIGHSHGWWWSGSSNDESEGTQTPASETTLGTTVLTTVPSTVPSTAPATVPSTAPATGPTTAPATVPTTEPTIEPLRIEGTDDPDVEAVAKGEDMGSGGGSRVGSAWNGEAEVEHASGSESGSWSLSGSGVEPESGPTIKPHAWSPLWEKKETITVQTNWPVGGDNTRVLAEDAKPEKFLTKTDLSSMDEYVSSVAGSHGDSITSQLNISINNSSEIVSIYQNTSNSSSSNWHDDLSNSTEYFYDLLTAERNRNFIARETPVTESPHCVLVDSALPFCHDLENSSFTVPNFFNQSSVEDVQAFLGEWAFLMESGCHHAVEWFFCLLAMPRCGVPGLSPQMPCRSFCELLIDSCWTLLQDRRLPVECSSLPEESDDGNQCLSVSTRKGKGRLECILLKRCILNQRPPVCRLCRSPVLEHFLFICPSCFACLRSVWS